MKLAIQSLSIFAIILGGSVSFAQAMESCPTEPVKVMITGFEPFAGRQMNGSQITAENLAALNSKNPCLQYEACILPVEYGRGADVAIDCFNRMNPKPSMVVSMGEADCSLRVETKAHNLIASAAEDNAGNAYQNQVINEEGRENELLTLPAPDMICASGVDVGPVTRASISPGYFVCNNTAYLLAQEFKPMQIPFGFIHVPTASCKVDFVQTAEKVNVMVQAAARALSAKTTIFSDKLGKDPTKYRMLESNRGEHIDLNKVVTPACRQQVLNKLRILSEKEREQIERVRSNKNNFF